MDLRENKRKHARWCITMSRLFIIFFFLRFERNVQFSITSKNFRLGRLNYPCVRIVRLQQLRKNTLKNVQFL